MVPLVDMHCHLLAGLDDGPATMETALEMCALAYADGVRLMCAGAHQNERYPEVTPDRIRQATQKLVSSLSGQGIAMTVFPCAEVMAQPKTVSHWREGRLLSIADRKRYVLLEMPHGVFIDLLPMAQALRKEGLRPLLAHPEREQVFLHEPGMIEAMIEAGCLTQVSSSSITDPKNSEDAKALKSWFKRGIVHVLGSDGHSPRKRPPLMAAAYRQVSSWIGPGLADRIASTNGLAIVHDLPLRIPKPLARTAASWWFPKFW